MVRNVAVIDIGKTNAKVLLIDLADGREIAVWKRPNAVLPGPPYPHADVDGLWDFVLASLADLARTHSADAISITTHGAAAALVDGAGELALPVLDYEHDGPDATRADYVALRPAFAETGSPALPAGLNLGAQLYWQARQFPAGFASAVHILMYPQYWAFRLTGRAASEATSLGCHTDLWNPQARGFSSLAGRLDWTRLFPPLCPAAQPLAPLLPALADRTGLPQGLPVYCGIHDSNASLLPYLGSDAALSVVSSGTWTISMAIGAPGVVLDPARDTLMNVNARGEPTPTARYMGGREFDALTEGRVVTPASADVTRILRDRVMVLPSLHPDTGPFPGLALGWTASPQTIGERCAAASLYVALMTAECLSLIGARGPVHVEGPFGGNRLFARMLATACGRPVLPHGASAGTGLGAAMLAGPLLAQTPPPEPVLPQSDLSDYAADWRARVAAAWAAVQGR